MWQASCLLLGSPSVESIVSLKRKRKLKNFELGNEIINDIFSSFHEGETKREILVLQVCLSQLDLFIVQGIWIERSKTNNYVIPQRPVRTRETITGRNKVFIRKHGNCSIHGKTRDREYRKFLQLISQQS